MAKKSPTKKAAPKVVVQRAAPKPKSEGRYHLKVRFNDNNYEGKTDDPTLFMRLIAPQVLKTKIFLKVSNGERSYEQVLGLWDGKRIFGNSIAGVIFDKQVRLRLGE
jgi:hypothetical protein